MASSFAVGNKFRERLRELLDGGPAVPHDLQKELHSILNGDAETILSFKTARKLKTYLQAAGHEVHLHELLDDSTLFLPKYEPPPRNPELVARLEKIKAKLANEEYDRITRNVNTQEISRHGTLAGFGKQEGTFCSDRSIRGWAGGALCSGPDHGRRFRRAMIHFSSNVTFIWTHSKGKLCSFILRLKAMF
ncbi:transmembrane protein 199 isoform X2 [Denticeps clupeoides]|uniref:transmembrane protein 199 isoform X2 n=1 Tax=Denticeps clupeoides TaxID=299321 RepID=UPI0010A2B4F6|nr:transmembrane protein 199 isoform X2 [Denticeps clupeoides]